jgi:hypothetical protein
MRRTSLILVLALTTVVSFAAAQDSRPVAGGGPKVTVPTFHNEVCPAMGKPVKTNLFVDTPNGRVYVCCKVCLKKVEGDPEAMYKKAYATTKSANNKTCPVTGEPVDAKSPKVTVQGQEIALCCKDCEKPLRANAQIYLAKLANPKINDLGNKVDPISGKPCVDNAFCLIGDDLVHLSCCESVDEVQKDPKKALEKAKEGKTADGAKEGEKKGGPNDGCCAGKADSDAGCCSGSKGKAKSDDGCCSGSKKADADDGCCSGAKAKAKAESQPAK